MANDFNSCTFTGRLGADPETRFLPDGKQVTNFSIACGETWKDKEGNKKDKTEWIRIVIFGKLAEIAAEYLKKGARVLISGKLQTRSWEDKDGNTRYSTEIVANQMVMLGGGEGKKDTSTRDEAPNASSDDIEDVPW